MMINKVWLPNILTIVRLVLSPLFIPFLIVYLVSLDYRFINILVAFLFFLFCLTDFFDGHYARKFNTLSKLGSLLDPIADKFLLYATIIPLVAIGKMYFFWAIIFIGREFFVMGLRLIGSENQIQIPVVFLAKCKTFLEMAYVGLLIMQTSHREWFFYEMLLLFASLFCALISAYQYGYFLYLELKRINNGQLF